MNGIIYKIESPTGKIYIGQTTKFDERMNRYKKLHCKEQTRLYRSLLKYGYENHKIDVIEDNIDNMEDLNLLEKFWIKKYNSFNSKYGLNLRSGGENSLLSDETKRKMSESKKGKFSGELNPMFGRKGELNPMFGRKGELHPMYGKTGKLTPMYGRKGELHPRYGKKGKLNGKSKKCYVLDLENKIIFEFESGNLTANYFNYKRSNITKICLGKGKTFHSGKYTAAYQLSDFVDRDFLEDGYEIEIIKK